MGLKSTTPVLTYARTELLKVGESFIFDKVGDMIYATVLQPNYTSAEDDPGRLVYIRHTGTAIASGKQLQGMQISASWAGTADSLEGGLTGAEIKARASSTSITDELGQARAVVGNVDCKKATFTVGHIFEAQADVAAGGEITTLKAVRASLNNSGTVGTGYAFIVETANTTYNWDYGFYCGTSQADIGLYVGSATTGIQLAGTQTTGITIGSSVTTGINVDSTTTSTAVTNGAIVCDGGLGVAGTATFGGTITGTRFIIDNDTWEDDGDGYFWGNRIRMDDTNAFASGAAKKTLALSIHMDRLDTNDMTGDSRDYGYYLDYTNRAQNDTGFNILGFRSQLSNSASGTLNIMRGIEQTVRQRGDGSTISDGIEAGLFSCNLDASGSVPANFAYGLRVHWRFHGNVPSDAAAFCAHNITDGVYTLASAFALRNDGTSGCGGFAFGLDCYDATSNPIDTADIRLSTGIYIMSGSGAPGATAPEGSVYFNTALTGGSAGSAVYLNTDGATNWQALT